MRRSPSLRLCAIGLVLFACDPGNQSVPEGEPDAALEAAPGCPYAPDPIGACDPFTLPAPVCRVDFDGAALGELWAGFDAEGREMAGGGRYLGQIWTLREQLDADGERARMEFAIDGCVSEASEIRPLGEGVLHRRRSRHYDHCAFTEVRDGTVLHRYDRGCDCRDVTTHAECEMGPHGPLRCREDQGDGTWSIQTYAYDDAGREVAWEGDWDGDGVPEHRRTWTYDADGRMVDEWFDCGDCEPPEVVRVRITFEDDPRRETSRRDAGDDGWAEVVRQRTYDEQGRLVRYAVGDDDGLPWVTETVYDALGGYRRVRTDEGQVTATKTVEVDGRRTTETTTEDDRQSVWATATDANGLRIEWLWSKVRGGEPYYFRHARYRRDDRGLLDGQRVQHLTDDGDMAHCTVDYAWSGACPTLPLHYEGQMCFGR